MSSVLLGVIVALLISVLIVLLRAFAGPTVFDRILAINVIGTKAVLIVALLGYLAGPARAGLYLDTALVYALINFVATVGILKLVEFKRLG